MTILSAYQFFRYPLLVMLIALSAIITALSFCQKAQFRVRQDFEARFNSEQLRLARMTSANIETCFNTAISDLSVMVDQDISKTGKRGYGIDFAGVSDPLSKKTSIRLLDKDGLARVLYPSQAWQRLRAGSAFRNQPFFQNAVKTGQVSVSGLVFDALGNPVVEVAVPVLNPETGFTQIIVGTFDLGLIAREIISPVVSGKSGYAWLLDSDGKFLAHHISGFVGQNAFSIRKEKNPKISFSAIEKIQKHMLAGEEGTGSYVSGWHREENEYMKKLVAYSPVSIGNRTWSVAVCAPMGNEISTAIDQILLSNNYLPFFISFVFMAGGLLVFVYFYRQVNALKSGLNSLIATTKNTNGMDNTGQDNTGQDNGRIHADGSDQVLKAIMKISPLGICFVVDRTIQWANQSLYKMLGYKYDTLTGKNTRQLYRDESDYEWIKKELYNGASFGLEDSPVLTKLVRKSGSIFDAAVRICPLDNFGASMGHVVLVTDLTDQVWLKREREKLEKKLNKTQRNETIGILAGGIAHDFNNILCPITGYAEIIAMDPISENSTVKSSAEEILKAANRAKHLISQILTFSRRNEGESRPIMVQSILKETLRLLEGIIPTTIKIHRRIQAGCHPVMGDPTQVHQVIMNLCTNAYQSMEKIGGTLDITLGEVRLDRIKSGRFQHLVPGGYLRLTVSDTGCGMEQGVMDKIFEPYFTTKENEKGTGLGLSVTCGIVTKLGGEIKVYSEPGRGSRFDVYLPLIENFVPDKADNSLFKGGPERGNERILLVDDDTMALEVQNDMLETLGYDVIAHTSSVEAFKTFQDSPDSIDMLITDLTMPDKTGDQLINAVRNIRADIPTILITGYSEKKIKAQIHNFSEIDAFLFKPITLEDLSVKIRHVFNRKIC